MQDKIILRMAIATSFIGLLIMFFLAQKTDFSRESLITSDNIDEIVSVRAMVQDISSSTKFTKINASACQEISIILFSKINLSEGDIIEAKGKIKENKGKSEMTADEIKILN